MLNICKKMADGDDATCYSIDTDNENNDNKKL